MKDQPTHSQLPAGNRPPPGHETSPVVETIAALQLRNAELSQQVRELTAELEELEQCSAHQGASEDPLRPTTDQLQEGVGDHTDHPLAIVDVVTGLPNRLCFQDRLASAISYSERFGHSFAVLFLDLDEFKTVNDTMGHSAGDELLRDIAGRLTGCVRKSDTVARLGGDEFTIILLKLREPELVARVAEKLIGALSEPFSISGRKFFLSASIGIATYPEDGTDVEHLIRNADTAMYEVKNGGKNGYHFYTNEMSERAISRMELEEDLRRAIDENQFVVHYQPSVDSYTEKTICAEALIRWQHPEKGLILPDAFMPVAEETGLITEVGRLILTSACEQARNWQLDGYEPISMAVNLSPLQFEQDKLVEMIMECLVASNLDSHWLQLEVTEGVILQNADHARKVLGRLRELGISVAIDDFGTGYSSLMQLRQLPIDCLKIDQQFIRNLPGDPDDETVFEAIVALGRKLNLTLLAEGVETPGQFSFLRELGCQRCQGDLFGEPMPAEGFTEFLSLRPFGSESGDDA